SEQITRKGLTIMTLSSRILEKRREERVVRADLCAQNFREPISQTHPVRGISAPAVRLFFVSPRSAKGGGVYA
ncbi:MAG: hypothetical protein UGE23_12340, partial [Peptococcaceae bacterium]|nr:hypothetical protein [Peptococcaceae bacterium]